MITGIEINMVVPDSIKAMEFYGRIFDVKQVEVSDFGPGRSETVFTIYGASFHLLDENPQFHLIAPKEGDPKPMWINITVPDIAKTYASALAKGCKEIFPITTMEALGLKNAMFSDPFGYGWMLHQIDKVISHEERMRILREAARRTDSNS